MEITVNPQLQARIEEKLCNGEFASADALVEQALIEFLESAGDGMAAAEFLATRSAVEQGLSEAEKGEGLSLEEFDRMMRARHGLPR